MKVLRSLLGKSRTSRDASSTLFTNALLASSSAVGSILAARLLGPEGRGQLAAAVVWAAVLGVIAGTGMPQALTYYAARNRESRGRIIGNAGIIFVSQSVLILTVGWLVVPVFLAGNRAELAPLVRLYLFSVPISLFATYMACIARGFDEYRLSNTIRASLSVAFPVGLGIAMAFRVHDVHLTLLAMLFSQTAACAWSALLFVMTVAPTRVELHRGQLRALLTYGIKSYPGSLSWMVNARLDQFLMSTMVSSTTLGIYAVGVTYSTALFPFSSAVATVLFPKVAVDQAGAPRRIRRAVKINLSVSVLLAALLAMLTPTLLPLLFGAGFRQAIVPAIILLVGTVFLGNNYVLSDSARGLGRPTIPSIAEGVGAALSVATLIALLPRFGAIGAAVSSALSYGVVSLILWVAVRRAALTVS